MKHIITIIIGAIIILAIFALSTTQVDALSKDSNSKLINTFVKENYSKCKVVFIEQVDTKKELKRITHRKGKNIVYVEKCISKSKGKYGRTIKGKYYIRYNKKVSKGKKVTSYLIWNPYTNYSDDIIAVVDNKMIRSDFH